MSLLSTRLTGQNRHPGVCVVAFNQTYDTDSMFELLLSARLTRQDEIRAVCVLLLSKAHETHERRVVCVVPFSKDYGTW